MHFWKIYLRQYGAIKSKLTIVFVLSALLVEGTYASNTDFMRCEFKSDIYSFSSKTPMGGIYPSRPVDAIMFKLNGKNLYFDYEDGITKWKKCFWLQKTPNIKSLREATLA